MAAVQPVYWCSTVAATAPLTTKGKHMQNNSINSNSTNTQVIQAHLNARTNVQQSAAALCAAVEAYAFATGKHMRHQTLKVTAALENFNCAFCNLQTIANNPTTCAQAYCSMYTALQALLQQDEYTLCHSVAQLCTLVCSCYVAPLGCAACQARNNILAM